MLREQYDYVVAGAGSAGCAVAARLSENGKYTVCLLEAGAPDNHFWVHMPLGVGKMLTNPKYVWQYMTAAEQHLAGRSDYWPRGRMLGGSSSLNGMVFVRGEPKRYDGWRDQGNPGWGWSDMLPFFRKLENRIAPEGSVLSPLRAQGGPITCTDTTQRDVVSAAWIKACEQWGVPFNPDYNAESAEGVGYMQFSIRNGRRNSTAVGYLAPAKQRDNLHIITGASVERLMLEGKKATGVQVRIDGVLKTVRAAREVILSAGPIISPKILELSGIGDPAVLAAAGVPVAHALPGVGNNLQDHLQSRINYRVNQPVTVNDLMNHRWRGALEMLKYLTTRKGLMATSSANAIALLRSHPSEAIADIKIQLTLYSAPTRYIRNTDSNASAADPFSGVGFGQIQLYPESRGAIHIASNDPDQQSVMFANYLDHPKDQEVTLRSMNIMREVAKQAALTPYIVSETLPGAACSTDEQMLDYVRQTGATSWHPMGSCRMGTGANDVVDERLRVRGIEGLRVIDSSIMPDFTSSNINIPTIAIGEKGAAMVLEDAQH